MGSKKAMDLGAADVSVIDTSASDINERNVNAMNESIRKIQEESLEMKLGQIEEIIRKMEEPNVSLDESFRLYQAGIEQLKSCNEMLDGVEKKMQILNAKGELSDFSL